MNLVIVSNADKVMIESNNLYPNPVPSQKMIWFKNQIVRFELQTNQSNQDFIDVLMNATHSWQLDNNGINGLPVSSINGADVSALSNLELLNVLFTI